VHTCCYFSVSALNFGSLLLPQRWSDRLNEPKTASFWRPYNSVIQHHRDIVQKFKCFCSGFAAETRYKGNTRRQWRNKFVLDEQQRTLKDHCHLTSSASNQSADANGESRNNYIYRRMYSRTSNIWRNKIKTGLICHFYASHMRAPLSLWKRQDTNTSPMSLSRAVFLNSGPHDPLPCMFSIFPSSATPDSNDQLVIKLCSGLIRSHSFELFQTPCIATNAISLWMCEA